MSDDDLSALWLKQWPECPPLAEELPHAYHDRWVRFHSLPESQRYPDRDAEYDIVLHRYNVVLDGLFRGQEVRIVTADWSNGLEPPDLSERHAHWHPGARYWTSVRTEGDETEPAFDIYAHLYVSRMPWRAGSIDDLLRAVADDETNRVMITSLSFDKIHHPYDGGADVLLPTTRERDATRHQHIDWLPGQPLGF
ncbi:hypothetical protein SAMN05421504_1133 [Amycolatopsis xylanica]|uniref:DUF3885 domain-containing protein n=1 Tax=Amycolatopsis xylanica TaxID=589385 RepID=A0A1H3S9P2_9PSEU|nr:hypothetical protein [Amycolatopsis xylanica]SDZ33859.1 hypothetical protein SAMN05421504_1133 [Amycolatopsis xylanica]